MLQSVLQIASHCGKARRAIATVWSRQALTERYSVLTKEKVLELLQQSQSYLSAEYGVKRIGVFGSFAKGQPGEASDIDIVVEFERPIGFRFIEFAEYLEQLLGRKVDVLTPAGIQGIRISRVAKDIAESVLYVGPNG